MAIEPRRKTNIADRRLKVSEMYLRGMFQTQIAEELGVNQATISRDLEALRKDWRTNSVDNFDQRVQIELAKTDQLELEYWKAWKRSLRNAETVIASIGPQGPTSTRKTVGQSGNPAFLEGVLKCIQKRCDLLGLDAPKKTDLTSGGEKIVVTLKGDD
jgi:DNA-binding transcriptional regulator LsrR (DeoR family)